MQGGTGVPVDQSEGDAVTELKGPGEGSLPVLRIVEAYDLLMTLPPSLDQTLPGSEEAQRPKGQHDFTADREPETGQAAAPDSEGQCSDRTSWSDVLGWLHAKRGLLLLLLLCALASLLFSGEMGMLGRSRVVSEAIRTGHEDLNAARYVKAVKEFDRALRNRPSQQEACEAYTGRGRADYNMGLYLEAVHDCDHAILEKPDTVTARVIRGLAYLQLGRISAAVNDFTQALTLDPDRPDRGLAHYGLGLAYEKLGKSQESVDNLWAAAILGNEEAQAVLTRKGIKWAEGITKQF